ncbi:MAG: tail fiber protein [Ginsengibacter sp.]
MIALFGFNFAPSGWLLCNGQLLAINQNQALFSLLGTTYGGNGTTNFALPDFQGRVPIHFGQGAGLSNYQIGQVGGIETVTLQIDNLPAHSHPLNAVSETGKTSVPAGAFHANTGALDPDYNTSGTVVAMNAGAIGTTGGAQPISILQPYLVVNYCIATQGIYPSRP